MANTVNFDKECCLCLEIFTEPRLLPCLHMFCSKCLENMGAVIPNDWLLCPVCGSKFTVPEKGVADLPKNVFFEKSADIGTVSKSKSAENAFCDACVSLGLGDKSLAERYCINCEKIFCSKCVTEHEKGKRHLIVDFSCQKETKTEDEGEACRCKVHQEETPKLYCTICKKVICDQCFLESHSSHNCSEAADVVDLVCKEAEKESNNVENMQQVFRDQRETLHREQMKFLEKVKRMETEILKRCEVVKELVVQETKALLQELAVLKAERLEEIGIEQKRLDKHIFTLEKFKEYCAWINSNRALVYTCEAESILRKTADELRSHQKRCSENRILPLQIEFQKAEIRDFVMPISNSIGKINVNYPYKMEMPTTIDTNDRPIHSIAHLQGKLYMLSDSILIYSAKSPYDRLGEINIKDIKSPTGMVSCCQSSRLYIHDKGSASIWKISIPDQRVICWLDEVRKLSSLSVTPNGEILLTTKSDDTKPSVTIKVYNKNGILIECIQLPKNVHQLERVQKTPSGSFIGYGEQHLYKFRRDGSIVCQSDITKYPDIGSCVWGLEVSTYHIFLISRPSQDQWGFKISLISSDFVFHHNLLSIKDKAPIYARYVKATKTLVVLEAIQVKIGLKMEAKRVVNVYSVF